PKCRQSVASNRPTKGTANNNNARAPTHADRCMRGVVVMRRVGVTDCLRAADHSRAFATWPELVRLAENARTSGRAPAFLHFSGWPHKRPAVAHVAACRFSR